MKISAIFVWILLLFFNQSLAQSIDNYSTSRTTGITFTSISGTGTSITSWRNGTSVDDNRSNSVTIPFDFWYLGVKYTTLCASTNGFIDFSSSAATGSSGAYGWSNSNFSTASGTLLALAPLYDDLKVTTLNSDVKYLSSGSYPNRIFTVEWLNTKRTSGSGTYNFQAVLHEGSGIVDFIYASTMATDLSSYSCGINGATISATPTSSELLSQTTANSSSFSNSVSNSLVTVPTASSQMTFTPTQSSTPTGLTATSTPTSISLSWNDISSNELGYIIYYSTSATGGFVPLSSASTLITSYMNVPGTTTATITGLAVNTTYYFNVFSLKESLSISANTSIATLPCSVSTIQASSVSFTNVLGSSMTINSTAGNGSGRIIKINTSNSFTNPVNGTDPSASATYLGGEQVVYNGSGTSVTVIGLSTNTTYYVSIYETNCTGASIYFNTTSPATGNQITLSNSSYVWTGASGGSWATTTNWTPNGTPTTGNNVLINTSVTIVSVPTVSIGSLIINNNCTSILQGGSTTTLTIENIAGTDLTISSGSSLTCGTGLNITLAASSTSDISGIFIINASRTFDVQGASSVTTVSGTITNSGTLTSSTNANLVFTQTGTYDHAVDGGTIPNATWNSGTPGATCVVTGCVNVKPTGYITTSNIFQNFTWNCTGLAVALVDPAQLGVGTLVAAGENMTCNGNLTISSFNGKTVSFSGYPGGASLSTLTVGGDFTITNGDFILNYWTNPTTMNVTGDFIENGGNFFGHGQSSGGATSINIGGNLNLSSGTFKGTSYGYSNVTFNISGNLNISGGTFQGSYVGGSPVYSITGNITMTAGTFYGTNSSGSPIFTTSNINFSGGLFYGTSSSGNPIFNISQNLTQTAGTFYGSYSSGIPIFTISQDISQTGGTFYGAYSSGSTVFNITRDLLISGGIFHGTDDSGSPVYTISRNMSISNTGTFKGATYSTGDPTFNIAGDLSTSGTAIFYGSTVTGGIPVFNIQGAVDLSSGTVASVNGYTTTTPKSVFNLTGTASTNLTLKTGLTYNSSAAWSWNISSGRTITLQSNIELGGTASSCVFTNNGTLILGTYTFPSITSAVASFVTSSGSTLKTAHLSGLSTTSSIGSIQVTGTKTFSSLASYVFNGTAAQVTGNFGSSTTPTVNTISNMEINNTSGLTLSESIGVSNTVTLTSGQLKTSSFTLAVGTTSSNGTITGGSSSNYIVAYDNSGTIGYLKLFVNSNTSYSFPIGDATNYTPLTFVLTSATLSSAFLTLHTKADKIPNLNSIITTNYINRYWELTNSGITSPVYGISYTYVDSDIIGFETGMSAVKKSGVDWYKPIGSNFIDGTSQGIGSFNDAINLLSWTGLSTFSFYGGVVDNIVALPIELISFIGTKNHENNELKWETSSETNCDYFTVEKTTDGINFQIVGKINGAGNSIQNSGYLLIDFEVRNIVNYYRLRQTDFDGQNEYSEIISIDNRVDTKLSKEIILKTNILGQKIDDNFKGFVILLFKDGTSIKTFQ